MNKWIKGLILFLVALAFGIWANWDYIKHMVKRYKKIIQKERKLKKQNSEKSEKEKANA
ncbi:MAG: hypothetical protein QXV17_15015 [Candidatus Micrarchaeaceae archaeon]